MGFDESEVQSLARTGNIYGISSWLSDRGVCTAPSDPRSCLGKNPELCRVEKELCQSLELSVADLDIIRLCKYGGIRNTGATCYLNTFVQAMFFNRDLRSVILVGDYGSELPLTALQDIMAELYMGNIKAVDPIRFVNSLAICRGTQEDSHEFSTLFINWLHKNIPQTSIRSLFEGSLINTFICPSCGGRTSHRESFLDLRVDFTDNPNIADLVQSIADRCDIIEGYSCQSEACLGKMVDITKQTSFKTLPKYLSIVLNRYSFDRIDGTREKITKPVKIKLNDFQIIQGKSYTCFGIIEHVSSSVSSGHYIGHFRDVYGDNTWYTFDDSVVKESKKFTSDVYTSNTAYVLYYVDTSAEMGINVPDVNPRVAARIRTENSERLMTVESKKSLKLGIETKFSHRKSQIESLLSFKFSQDQIHDWVVVKSDWLRDWGHCGDIVQGFKGDEILHHDLASISCQHAKIHPSSVLKGHVKYVPREMFPDLDNTKSVAECVCEPCSNSFREELEQVLVFGKLLEELLESSEDPLSEYTWINEKVLKQKFTISFRKSLTSVETVLRKYGKGQSGIQTVDVCEGVKCIHGNLRMDAHTVLKKKPKKLIEHLLSFTCPDFFPRLVSSGNDLSDTTCAECVESETVRVSFVSYLSNLINRKNAESSYSVIPVAWIRRVIRGISGRFHEFKSIVCEHGKLSRAGKFIYVSKEEMERLNSDEFRRTMLGQSIDEIPTLGNEICDVCSASAGTHVNVRVFDSAVSGSGEVHDHERAITVLHRPGRSRLYGTTGEVDLEAMVGRDLKMRLVDLGIMGDDEVHEGAEDEMNLYVSHPLLRGSLIRLEDDTSVNEVLRRVLEGTGRAEERLSSCLKQDTLYVEFLVDRKSPGEPKKKTRRVQANNETEAGLKGSILRDLPDSQDDSIIDLS